MTNIAGAVLSSDREGRKKLSPLNFFRQRSGFFKEIPDGTDCAKDKAGSFHKVRRFESSPLQAVPL